MLDWLEAQPGSTWQDRWHAGCRAAAGQDWRDIAERWLKDTGRIAVGNQSVWRSLGGALGLLIGRDVIRPDLGWLLASATPAHLAADMARIRDPAGFAALEEAAGPASVSVTSTRRAMLQVAVIMAVKGGMAGDITVGDCLELLEARARAKGDSDNGGTYFYQLLHAAGFLPAGAPPRAGMLNPRVRGQLSAGQLIDRYDLACRPVRDLLVDYLNERRPGIDYVTMNGLAYQLGLLFWKDLETHHPGIDSLNLAPDVAVAWKQRMQSRTVQTTGPGGERTQARVPRLSVVDHLTIVRSFYLDIAEWAATDPSRWAQWAVPCPVRPGDLTHRQALRRRKSRTDQRTRERLPVLPRLIAAAERELTGAASRLAAAAAAAPGQEFTAGGQTLARAILKDPSPRIWAEDRGTGKRRNLTEEEEHAFWAWASIELLRHSGIRIEELAELSHHSLVRYQLPGAELIPLLHITPSKTDIERMLVISPELSEVLAVVIARVRGQGTGAVPLVTAYDPLERVWNPPSPLLLQRRAGAEDRPFSRHYIKRRIEDTARAAGLTASTGGPLTFTPHDMRRIFTTEALQNGLPPHICQLILGHYAGDLVKLIMLGDCLVEAGQESVEDSLPPGLALGGGVVALLLEGGPELDGGLEEGAGLADRLEVAVQADGPGAVAVAEHPLVHLGAELAHLGALGAGGQVLRGVVEGLDLLRHREVLLGHGAVGDAGIHHGHPHRSMSQKGGYRLQAHAPVDRLGGQRVPEPVRADVADPGGLGGFGDGPVDAALADPLAVLDEEVRGAQAGGPCGEPAVQEVLELGVQRDIAVGAQLAERHVQPVGGADLHDGVDGKVQELAFAQAGAGQELHGQADERVGVGAGGLQQLGERAVVQEPGQRLVAQRQVAGEDQHRGGDIAAVPLGEPLEAGAQRAEVLGEADPGQVPAASRWPGGQVQLIGLDVAAAQVGDAADLGRVAGQPAGELAQHALDAHHGRGPQRQAHLGDVAGQGRRQQRRRRLPIARPARPSGQGWSCGERRRARRGGTRWSAIRTAPRSAPPGRGCRAGDGRWRQSAPAGPRR